MKKYVSKKMGWQLTACSAILCSSMVQADDKGVVESLTDFNINETKPLKDLGINVGGWVSVGIAGNFDDPRDNVNGPVTFNNRSNEFNAHQLYGFIEKAVDKEAGKWDLGFRADVIYGIDAFYTTQANFDNKLITDSSSRLYKLAFPQVYAELFAPIGNGITTKIGHFYTIIGNEVVTAPDNFFFSHAYTMQYGEPFTHTGIISSYDINKNISVTGGVVTGWDSFFQESANFLGGVSYTTDDERTSVAASLISGDVGRTDEHNRTMYSIVVNHDIADNLHYTFQHDLGIEESSPSNESFKWYGVNQYLTYDVNDDVSTGVRFEWFRDEDGSRVGVSDHFFAVTAGVNYSPLSWLMIRPEVRYDWATEGNPYDNGSDDDQFLISADAIIRF